jgi:hypothetical protein
MKPNHVAITKSALNKEAKKATTMLKGKTILQVWRHRPKEIGIEFTDGTRLFVDMQEDGLELSITEK